MNEKILSKLRPWQVEPARHLQAVLREFDSALDSSDTGTGKTFVSAAVAVELGLPTLVVCPEISISVWHSVAAHFDEKFSVVNYEYLRTGNTPFGSWKNQPKLRARRPFSLVCQFCQRRFEESNIDVSCYTNESGIHCVDRKSRPIVYGQFIFNQAVKFLIFDEVHRCGGLNSLNADILIGAKRQKIKHLMLSATPAQTILQMKAIGYSLDLFEL